MRPQQAFISTSIALLVAALPALATASPSFPGGLQAELSLSYTPPCTVCHAGPPMLGTATQPFALSMRARGLVQGDLDALAGALEALEADENDSDCDGVPDVEQLRDGRNPSTGAAIDDSGRPAPPTTGCGDAPAVAAYGCGAQVAGGPLPAGAGAAAVAAALGLAALRRRRSG